MGRTSINMEFKYCFYLRIKPDAGSQHLILSFGCCQKDQGAHELDLTQEQRTAGERMRKQWEYLYSLFL